MKVRLIVGGSAREVSERSESRCLGELLPSPKKSAKTSELFALPLTAGFDMISHCCEWPSLTRGMMKVSGILRRDKSAGSLSLLAPSHGHHVTAQSESARDLAFNFSTHLTSPHTLLDIDQPPAENDDGS